MLQDSAEIAFGAAPPDFALNDPAGKTYQLQDVMGPNGLLMAFICNHCPYVVEMMPRFAADIVPLREAGIGVICINANDYGAYPADAPDKMAAFADQFGMTAPYVVDEDQSVARAFGAVCTPDFFGYGRDSGLQYRGRLDDVPMGGDASKRNAELLSAMHMVATTGKGPAAQVASIGCSIKWR